MTPSVRIIPRLLIRAVPCVLAMSLVGLFLSVLGIFVLKVSGGAAHDTSLVVMVAAFAVSDFWGGGVLAALGRAGARETAIAWGVVRAVALLLAALAFPRLAVLVPVQLIIAVPAAFLGARVGARQAALRRAGRPPIDGHDLLDDTPTAPGE